MYQFTKAGGGVVRLSDGAFVPFAPGNADYAAYMRWVVDGGKTLGAPLADPRLEAQRQLDALESTTGMSRFMREYLLVSMQDLATRSAADAQEAGVDIGPQEILNANVGWLRLVAVNAQCIALRKAAE